MRTPIRTVPPGTSLLNDTMSLKPVVAIIGATATGKTKLGVAVAKMLCGEVVGLDSLQCYRHGGVVTARPMEGEMEGVPHHMVGCMVRT